MSDFLTDFTEHNNEEQNTRKEFEGRVRALEAVILEMPEAPLIGFGQLRSGFGRSIGAAISATRTVGARSSCWTKSRLHTTSTRRPR
jgi:hypothetical protein